MKGMDDEDYKSIIKKNEYFAAVERIERYDTDGEIFKQLNVIHDFVRELVYFKYAEHPTIIRKFFSEGWRACERSREVSK